MLESAHSRYTVVQTRVWVDDLVQRMIGPVSRIQHLLEEAGLFVLKGLREAGFTISPKTTLVTTDRELSTRLVEKYRAFGFPVHSAMSAADLGIDRGFAARRRIPKHTRRWKKRPDPSQAWLPRNWTAFGLPQSTHSCHGREVDAAQQRLPLP